MTIQRPAAEQFIQLRDDSGVDFLRGKVLRGYASRFFLIQEDCVFESLSSQSSLPPSRVAAKQLPAGGVPTSLPADGDADPRFRSYPAPISLRSAVPSRRC